MEAAKVLSHSKTVPFGFSIVSNNVSLRPFNKYFHADARTNNYQLHPRPKRISFQFNCSYGNSFSTLLKPEKRADLLPPPRCSISSEAGKESRNPFINYFRNLSFDSIKANISQLTPIDIVKWSGILTIITAATKWTLNMLVSPFFWMYFSWTWLFWPWVLATVLAVYGLYCCRKHLLGEANIFEQLATVTSVFTWLTLVPPGVMVGHWLAAFEGPELHLIPGGWNNLGIWALIIVTVLMQYNATLHLAKYSENVVVPNAVVQFGPYRWVRHPIYSSTMLLFATYCIALRAPLSMLFLVAVCSLYYKQKAEMEEALMVETFGQSYTEYANKVKSKLIPFIY
ncbi:putative phospholipid methyltransferase [Lupinus albus]|uniref:Putative phospholipid methyltransferase n=1 Tax=Lupinus albus TaxID=3870 RepID=A0A6A4R459_LUPAL|nr:putative phospholipid methyltransferase [Lupinus albus]